MKIQSGMFVATCSAAVGAILWLSAGLSLADEVSRGDLLKAVKDFGKDYGTADSCLAWAAGIYPQPSLPEVIEVEMFESNIDTDDISYFKQVYHDAYVESVDSQMPFFDFTNGEICAQISAEDMAQARVRLQGDLYT